MIQYGTQMYVRDFFAHENSSCPPPTYNFGKLQKPKNKSDIVCYILKSSKVFETTVIECVLYYKF